MINLGLIISKGEHWIKRNSPTILSFLGSIGVIGTTIVTSKMTNKITKNREEIKKKSDEGLYSSTQEEGKEIFKNVWLLYLPIVIAAGGTIGCIWGSRYASAQIEKKLTSALALTTFAFNKYREKVKERFGEEKEEEIYQEMLEELPKSTDEIIKFYDPLLGFSFETTFLHFLDAYTELNRSLHHNNVEARLFDFYSAIPEIKTHNIPERAKYYGWDYDMFMDDPAIWIDYTVRHIVSDDDNFYELGWLKGPSNLENIEDEILDSLYPYEE